MPRSNFCEDYHREFLEKKLVEKESQLGGVAFSLTILFL